MRRKRIVSLLLVGFMMISLLLPVEVSAAHENTYVNTGNYRTDIIGVARTQIGYRETFDNRTKYGAWLGVDDLPWCASFISWCARQAGIPTSVIKNSSVASPGYSYFNLTRKDGREYTPVPGDLFFKRDFSHVGLVYQVVGEYIYTIEGNTNYLGAEDGLYVMVHKRKISDCYFGTYKNSNAATPEAPVVRTAKSTYSSGQTIQVTWDAVSGAQSYDVVIYEDSKKQIKTSVGSNTYYHFVSPKAGEYMISVTAYFAGGKTSYGETVVEVKQAPSLSVQYNINGGKVAYPHQYVVVGGEGVDFRSGPYTYTTKYGVIPVGTLLTASDIFENGTYIWAKVTYNGKTGWCLISKGFCERVGYDTMENGDIIQYPEGTPAETAWGAGSGEKKGLLDPQTANLTKENHTFAGWSAKQDGSGPVFRQDQTQLSAQQIDGSFADTDKNVKMYAIWRKTVKEVSVVTLPYKTNYVTDDVLDTTGLTLRAKYADGTEEVVSTGFTVTGFDASSEGEKTVTVAYYDAKTSFTVNVDQRMQYTIDDGAAVITGYKDNGGVVIIPNTLDGMPVKRIAPGAFADCSRITGLILTGNVTEIGDGAFSECSSLSVVNYTGTKEQWDAIRIGEGNEVLTSVTLVTGYKVVGDFTGDLLVDNNDVIALLKHSLAPNRFPISENADLNADGRVDNEDVILLLKHSLVPDRFPLAAAMMTATIEEPVEEPTQEPAEETTQEPAEESTQESTEEPAEEPTQESTEEPTGESGEDITEEV